MRSAYAALLALFVAVPAEADAQKRELGLRLDSLVRSATSARAAVRAYDDSLRRARALDTAYIGAITVVAEHSIAAETRAIMPSIVDSLEALIGQATGRLAGYTLSAHVEYQVGWRRGADTTREVITTVSRPNGARGRSWRAPLDSPNLEASLRYAIMHTAFAAANASFFAWAGNVIPHDTMGPTDWAHQRLLLVSSGSAVANRCYRGDVRACRMALVLSPSSDPILDWHDGTTRRGLVRKHGGLAKRMDAHAQQQCLAGSDAACIAVLRLAAPATLRDPAAGALRTGLLRQALAVGGPGSLERLLLSNETNHALRLEAAARMPIDTLIMGWRARLREARAPSEDLTIGITILSLAWAGAFGALSLRSSRWR